MHMYYYSGGYDLTIICIEYHHKQTFKGHCYRAIQQVIKFRKSYMFFKVTLMLC